MAHPSLLQSTDRGLSCPAADVSIDPWGAVPRAVVTHAHADHLQPGCASYLVARDGLPVARARLGDDAVIETVAYGEPIHMNGVEVSLHPAGHILGSAQVRLAYRGEVAVVSGDYRPEPSATCAPFEPVRCDTFVSESTFGLPIFRWAPDAEVFAAIDAWWAANARAGRASLLFGYALGKAQRLLAGVDPTIGPIYTHGAVERLVAAYRAGGVLLPPTRPVADSARNRLGRRPHRRTALDASVSLDTPLRDRGDRHRFGLDAHPRHASTARRRPGLRPLRPRRLAGSARRHHRHRRGRGLGHPRLYVGPRALAARAGHGRPRAPRPSRRDA